ncbi:MAG: hypothetical protein AB7P03_28560 [Kofleriaceae bacterium]
MRPRWLVATALVAAGCFDPVPAKRLGCSETDRCPDGEICFADGVCGPDDVFDGPPPFTLGAGTVSAIDILNPGVGGTSEHVLAINNVDDSEFALLEIDQDGLVSPLGTIAGPVGSMAIMFTMTGTDTLIAWKPSELRMATISSGGVPGYNVEVDPPSETTGLTGAVLEPASTIGLLSFQPATSDLRLVRRYVGGGETAPPIRIDSSDPLPPALFGAVVSMPPQWLVVYTQDEAEAGKYAVVEGYGSSVVRNNYPFVPLNPRLAGTTDRIGLVYDNREDVMFVPLSRAAATVGQPLGTPTAITHADRSMFPNVATDGTSFGVVWVFDRHPGSEYDLYFAAVDETGAITVAPRRIATVPGLASAAPNIVWWPAGAKYVVSWVEPDVGTRFVFVAPEPG